MWRADRSAGDAPTPIVAGSRVELGDGVVVQVVDARPIGQATVLDLAILVDDLAVLLPGPAPQPDAGQRWTRMP